jgi:transposase
VNVRNAIGRTDTLWLYGRENVPESRAEQFATLRAMNLKTARAWAIKEMLRDLWDCPSGKDAEAFHARWHGWAARCRLVPVRKVAAMVKSHLHNILTYVSVRRTPFAARPGISREVRPRLSASRPA